MILPTKGIPVDQALLTIGGKILQLLKQHSTVSELWESVKADPDSKASISFDWFVFALDLLYSLGAIELKSGLILPAKREVSP